MLDSWGSCLWLLFLCMLSCSTSQIHHLSFTHLWLWPTYSQHTLSIFTRIQTCKSKV